MDFFLIIMVNVIEENPSILYLFIYLSTYLSVSVYLDLLSSYPLQKGRYLYIYIYSPPKPLAYSRVFDHALE